MTDGQAQAGTPPLTIYLIKQLELAVRSFLDEALRPFGLTTFQYTALTVLGRREGGLSSAQLARRSFVRPQTMNEMVHALEARGLIERVHEPGNRRVMLATLTPGGRELLDACEPHVQELERLLLRDMPAGQRALFRRSLENGIASLTHAR